MQGLGSRVSGLGLGLRISVLGLKVEGLGFRTQMLIGGPQDRPQNIVVPITGTAKRAPLVLENPHMCVCRLQLIFSYN